MTTLTFGSSTAIGIALGINLLASNVFDFLGLVTFSIGLLSAATTLHNLLYGGIN